MKYVANVLLISAIAYGQTGSIDGLSDLYYLTKNDGISIDASKALCGGLIGAWMFDEGGGLSLTSKIGNRYVGTLTNATWAYSSTNTVAGNSHIGEGRLRGPVVDFNNNNRATISSGSELRPTKALSIVVWFRTTGIITVGHTLLGYDKSSGQSYNIRINGINANSIEIGSFDGAWRTAFVPIATMDEGDWNLAVGTYDGINMRMHLNGGKASGVGAGPAAGLDYTSPNLLAFGVYWNNGLPSGQFNGYIAYILLYNRVLSIDESQAIYRDPWFMYPDPPTIVPISVLPFGILNNPIRIP